MEKSDSAEKRKSNDGTDAPKKLIVEKITGRRQTRRQIIRSVCIAAACGIVFGLTAVAVIFGAINIRGDLRQDAGTYNGSSSSGNPSYRAGQVIQPGYTESGNSESFTVNSNDQEASGLFDGIIAGDPGESDILGMDHLGSASIPLQEGMPGDGQHDGVNASADGDNVSDSAGSAGVNKASGSAGSAGVSKASGSAGSAGVSKASGSAGSAGVNKASGGAGSAGVNKASGNTLGADESKVSVNSDGMDDNNASNDASGSNNIASSRAVSGTDRIGNQSSGNDNSGAGLNGSTSSAGSTDSTGSSQDSSTGSGSGRTNGTSGTAASGTSAPSADSLGSTGSSQDSSTGSGGSRTSGASGTTTSGTSASSASASGTRTSSTSSGSPSSEDSGSDAPDKSADGSAPDSEDGSENATDIRNSILEVKDARNAVNEELKHSLVKVSATSTASTWFDSEASSTEIFSGIIIDIGEEEILILTSSNIAKSDSIKVIFENGISVDAYIKQTSETDSLAVLAVSSVSGIDENMLENLKIIDIVPEGEIEIGEPLIACGSPLGMPGSVAYGDVGYIEDSEAWYDGCISVMYSDMRAKPDNGTFVVDYDGRLIGIISAPVSKGVSEEYARIVSADSISDIIDSLKNGEKLPYLGIKAMGVTFEMRYSGVPEGCYVRDTEQNKAAYSAGIMRGDIISSINGTPVKDMDEYESELRKCLPETEIELTVNRQAAGEYKEMSFTLTVGER